jgi:hypothetical protein
MPPTGPPKTASTTGPLQSTPSSATGPLQSSQPRPAAPEFPKAAPPVPSPIQPPQVSKPVMPQAKTPPPAPPTSVPPQQIPKAATPPPSSQPAKTSSPTPTPTPGSRYTPGATNDQAAQRLARLLVSEIKLYNEKKIADGKRNNNLYDVLKDTIEQSRKHYKERMGAALDQMPDYFHEELVKTLCEGDATKLGPNYKQ